MGKQPQGCARVTGTVAGQEAGGPQSAETPTKKDEKIVTARVGQKAPDFAAPAYYRGGFTIDPDGVIHAMEVLTPPVGRKFAESVRQIQAYQHVRATGGKEATPAGWMPGDLTLTPGPDLVGNVWKVWKPAMEK
jgi:alkyl hydroperoxide reductase subunit AhpC